MKYAKYIACLTVALSLTVELFAQTAVSGRITDKNGESVIGATILVKGTTTGTSSDAEGRYKIVIPAAAEKTLQVSYLGYKPQEIAVGTRTRIDIELESDEAQIEEVVVVGYGTAAQERRDGSRHLGQNRQERSRAGRLVRQTASGPSLPACR
ncbi:MAG: carboxypeptidase-like regulatory domain-containing protein [Alistipes finegoldii]